MGLILALFIICLLLGGVGFTGVVALGAAALVVKIAFVVFCFLFFASICRAAINSSTYY